MDDIPRPDGMKPTSSSDQSSGDESADSPTSSQSSQPLVFSRSLGRVSRKRPAAAPLDLIDFAAADAAAKARVERADRPAPSRLSSASASPRQFVARPTRALSSTRPLDAPPPIRYPSSSSAQLVRVSSRWLLDDGGSAAGGGIYTPPVSVSELHAAANCGTASARSALSVGGATSGGSARGSAPHLISNAKVGEFLIVMSGGSTGLAVHEPTGRHYTVRALRPTEVTTLDEVRTRLCVAHRFYPGVPQADINELSNMLLSDESRTAVDSRGVTHFFLPKRGTRSLYAWVQMLQNARTLSERDVQPIMRAVTRFVAFCHRIGIIARDLKMRQFVLIDEEDDEMMMDSPHQKTSSSPRANLRLSFIGACDVFVLGEDRLGEDTLRCRYGSPGYAPPEVLNRAAPATQSGGGSSGSLQMAPYAGKAADMWSLGVLLFCLLAGRYPFYDTTPHGLFFQIRRCRVEIPANVRLSPMARALIFGLLRRCPLERPSANQLLQMPWIASDSRDLTAEPVFIEPPPPPPSRSTAAAAAAVVEPPPPLPLSYQQARAARPNLEAFPATRNGGSDTFATLNNAAVVIREHR